MPEQARCAEQAASEERLLPSLSTFPGEAPLSQCYRTAVTPSPTAVTRLSPLQGLSPWLSLACGPMLEVTTVHDMVHQKKVRWRVE